MPLCFENWQVKVTNANRLTDSLHRLGRSVVVGRDLIISIALLSEPRGKQDGRCVGSRNECDAAQCPERNRFVCSPFQPRDKASDKKERSECEQKQRHQRGSRRQRLGFVCLRVGHWLERTLRLPTHNEAASPSTFASISQSITIQNCCKDALYLFVHRLQMECHHASSKTLWNLL